MIDQRCSDSNESRRDIPSFIEPRPPLISNPFMRPRPQKGTNLLELFEEDSDCEEPELVQVYLRLKPCNIPSNLYEVKSDRCLITSLDTATVGHGRRTQHNVSKMYSFTHIFGPEANQKELFERVVMDNLKKLPEGNSFTLLTYGASGSGKTFTLMGTVAAPGLVPRSLEYVFRVVDAAQKPLYKPADNGAEKLSKAAQEHELQFVKQMRHVSVPLRDKYRRMSVQLRNDLATSDMPRTTEYYVWVSFVEIYNEGIYDLLSTSDRSAASKLVIREDSNGNVYVKGATQVFVRTGEEAYDVMVAGKHNLQVAATGVHAHSSRSHCIFTITMLTQTDVGCRVSSVRLCDLAGCERVRRTRNAGARLAESRAINSSLHVLERCLRTLRRRQRAGRDALVPYRESKLTRLLGAGLSGARGEAVSVVVTLNPAPECAHETRHVLQLAAVARDIQVNNTVSEYSSLEMTSHADTIIAHNPDVMKLRSDNERLHFELVRAQARNKELLAAMEERQAKTADTIKEFVAEAKDLTRQYYEARMQSLRDEMEEMKEEYEARLSKLASQALSSSEGTPSRALQNKISQLMREIAILEEKLSAEELARARAEEELQHLRACIDERDEKAYDDAQNQNEEVTSVTDSEDDGDEEEEDSCNESLEPTFKKEDINRSRLMRQSLANVNHTTNDDIEIDDNGTNSVIDDINNHTVEKINGAHSLENSGDTLKYSDVDNEKTYTSEVEDSVTCEENNKEIDEGLGEISRQVDYVNGDKSFKKEEVKTFNSSNREMYFINDDETVLSSSDAVEEKSKMQMLLRGTYFVRRSQDDSKSENSTQEEQESNFTVEQCQVKEKHENTEQKEEIKPKVNMPLAISDTLVNKILNSLKSNSSVHNSNTSLTQFEQLEMAANDLDPEPKRNTFDALRNIKILKEKRIFFCDNIPEEPSKDLLNTESNKESKVFFDNLEVNVENEDNKRVSRIKNIANLKNDDVRSPSIVKEETTCDFKQSTMKKLLGESLTRQADPISVIHKANILTKKSNSIDVFEGYDSPQIEIPPKSKQDDVENLRKSIESTVLSNELAKIDVKCKIKSEKHVEKEIQVVPKPPKSKQDDVENLRKSIENTVLSDELAKTDVKCMMNSEKHIEKEIQAVLKPVEDNTLHVEANAKGDNTLDEFEKIYRDISEPRASKFDLLEAEDVNMSNTTKDTTTEAQEFGETKYNLRKKQKSESQANCENKGNTKKSLRLRRRKNQDNDSSDQERSAKLKDIVNLQEEFSDVTMDMPAPKKEVKDIASPVKIEEEENLPPMQGIQSCPSKSVTRSRRKLFTPRAEPLEESLSQVGDSNERVRVPRPSYHRPRARRKL
ncbi:unnamed protein product [Parnassius mnemosyne]|uniref:Kinesin motor domain-containing protein n=1 Tax=Parnassius mnemosyne TaxID=213953 RepID=A0AAV1KQ18_9NEOP